jgi:hypothetical protein
MLCYNATSNVGIIPWLYGWTITVQAVEMSTRVYEEEGEFSLARQAKLLGVHSTNSFCCNVYTK